MSSLNFIQQRNLAKRGVIGHIITDSPVAIRIRHTGASAVTSVTLTAATNIVLIDADGTTTSTFATDDTLQKVANRINASANWQCRVLDSLGAAASASRMLDGAISASTSDGVTYYDALLDTNTALQFCYRLSFTRSVADNLPRGSHRVTIKEIKYSVNMGTAAADSVQLYQIKGSVETKLASWLSVDTTATTINWASGVGEITAPDGWDLLVLVKDAATLADDSGNYLDVVGFVE